MLYTTYYLHARIDIQYLCTYEHEYGCEYVFVWFCHLWKGPAGQFLQTCCKYSAYQQIWYDLVGFLHMRIIPAAFLLHLASVAGIGESDAWKRMQTLPAVGTCEFDSKVDSNKSALLILLLFF